MNFIIFHKRQKLYFKLAQKHKSNGCQSVHLPQRSILWRAMNIICPLSALFQTERDVRRSNQEALKKRKKKLLKHMALPPLVSLERTSNSLEKVLVVCSSMTCFTNCFTVSGS